MKGISDNDRRLFRSHYFDWATNDFVREISQGYPFLKRVRTMHSEFVLALLTPMDHASACRLAGCLVKRNFAGRRWTESIELTLEEQKIVENYFERFRKWRWSEVMTPAVFPINVGGRFCCPTFSEGDLVRNMDCFDHKELWPEGGWIFSSAISGWLVKCRIFFDSPGKVDCDYYIMGSNLEPLLESARFLGWLGIAGSSEWGYTNQDEADDLACTLPELSRHFLAGMHGLLKHLK